MGEQRLFCLRLFVEQGQQDGIPHDVPLLFTELHCLRHRFQAAGSIGQPVQHETSAALVGQGQLLLGPLLIVLPPDVVLIHQLLDGGIDILRRIPVAQLGYQFLLRTGGALIQIHGQRTVQLILQEGGCGVAYFQRPLIQLLFRKQAALAQGLAYFFRLHGQFQI